MLMGSWWKAKHIITIFHADGHWVTVQIHLDSWQVEVYDSLTYMMMDPDDEPMYSICEHQLWPLLHLIPGLLRHLRYWERSRCSEIHRPLEYQRMPLMYQFRQTDGVSCGIFSVMQANRLISSKTFNFDPS